MGRFAALLTCFVALGCSLDLDALQGGDAGPAEASTDAGRADGAVPDGAVLDGAVLDGDLADAGPPPRVVQVAAGGGTTCARASDGAVYCWGDNTRGQVGPGGIESIEPTPRRVDAAPAAGFVDLAVGTEHACAVGADAKIYCWGDSTSGQLGQLFGAPQPDPQVVDLGEPAIAVAAGRRHTCAIVAVGGVAGRVHCWGDNDQGQLGRLGAGAGFSAPMPIDFAGAASAIAAGDHFTCAIFDRRVRCWGSGAHEQLARPGFVGTSEVAQEIANIATPDRPVEAEALALGPTHACALDRLGSTADDRVYCWGDNRSQQVLAGPGSSGASRPRVFQDRAGWSGVLALGGDEGRGFSCAGTADGELRCRGANERGALAQSTDACEVAVEYGNPPRTFGFMGAVIGAAAGAEHLCVLGADHAVYCAGDNSAGQLGRAPMTPACSNTSLRVVGLP